jgi:hypothetical protein
VEINAQGSSQNVEAMYVKGNIEGRSYNNCYSGKAVNISYSECAFVVLVIQHAIRMRRIAVCGLFDSTKCFHIKVAEHKKCVFVFSTNIF